MNVSTDIWHYAAFNRSR